MGEILERAGTVSRKAEPFGNINCQGKCLRRPTGTRSSRGSEVRGSELRLALSILRHPQVGSTGDLGAWAENFEFLICRL